MTGDNDQSPRHNKWLITAHRFVGWWFLVIGGIMFAWHLTVLFDPNAEMLVNGVPTKSFSMKLGTAVFLSVPLVLGALLAFTPRKKIEQAFDKFNRFAKDFVTQHRK